MLNSTTAPTLAGLTVGVVVIILTILRQRRFELVDLGYFAAAYFAGSNLPPAFVLFMYGITPDPTTAATKLNGYEKYIAFAGLSLFVLSATTIWALYQKAYSTDSKIILVEGSEDALSRQEAEVKQPRARTGG